MKKKLLIDMDNTLNDFGEAFVQEVIDLGIDYDISFLQEYNIENGIQVEPKKEKKRIKELIFSKESFWLNIPPKENSYEALEYLSSVYEVIIATTPWRFEDKYTNVKTKWMEKTYPFFDSDKIIFSDKKYELIADGIIDDKVDTLELCQQAGMYSIAFHQPYNALVKSDFRLFSWEMKEVETLIHNFRK